MFGLSLEKLVAVAIVAAIVIGPHRLPRAAERLAAVVRSVRAGARAAAASAERELGVPLDPAEWTARAQQYDPRRIIREALEREADAAVVTDSEPAAERASSRWAVVGGSSGHPKRVRIAGDALGDAGAGSDPLAGEPAAAPERVAG